MSANASSARKTLDKEIAGAELLSPVAVGNDAAQEAVLLIVRSVTSRIGWDSFIKYWFMRDALNAVNRHSRARSRRCREPSTEDKQNERRQNERPSPQPVHISETHSLLFLRGKGNAATLLFCGFFILFAASCQNLGTVLDSGRDAGTTVGKDASLYRTASLLATY